MGGPAALMDGVENAHARWESFDVQAHDLSVLTAWTTWAVITIQDSLIKRYRVFYTEREARLAAGFATED
jgi:hypothetical protein